MSTALACCFLPDAPPASVRRCLLMLGFAGPAPDWRWHVPGLLTVNLDAMPEPAVLDSLRGLPGMERVVDRSSVFVPGARPATVQITPELAIGPDRLTVIGGPCSVESEAQICAIADAVAEAGGDALRGGAFKPRSSPYAFGGLGEAGLEHLARARERTGLPVVTEVLDAGDLDVIAEYADVLQIGARNMQNYPLLFRIGSHRRCRPVLFKRGLAATLDEYRLATEYLLLGQLYAGLDTPALLLCERGIRTFEPAVRFGFDIAAIPALRDSTALPVLADPSHPAGQRDYVRPLARAAVAAGADGLLVEVHTDPDNAWSDGEQTLDPAEFGALVREVRAIAALRAPPATGLRDVRAAAAGF